MELAWDDRRTRQFVTNVGLVTTDGPMGPNIMAAEWTHHVSYSPSLIAINIDQEDTTAKNIDKTKVFGVSLTAEDQNFVASISGGSHGEDVDKIAVLKALGIKFYSGKKIKVPMLKGAAMNAECKLVKKIELGDHIMYVGEVVDISADESIKSIVYHNGRFWKFGESIQKPPPKELEKMKALVEKHRKKK